jgi:hypothetical protein
LIEDDAVVNVNRRPGDDSVAANRRARSLYLVHGPNNNKAAEAALAVIDIRAVSQATEHTDGPIVQYDRIADNRPRPIDEGAPDRRRRSRMNTRHDE